MKKRIISLLLAVVMVVSLLPVTVSAANTITAPGGSNLQAEINKASSGGTIILTGDYTNGTPASEKNYIMISGKSLTIDLNGHTIDAKNKGQRVIYVSGNGTGNLTIKDSTGGGKISGGKANDNGGGAIYLDKGATLTMYGGSITGNTSTGDGSAIYINYGAVANIYGGEVCNNKTLTSGKDRPIVLASKSGETSGALYLGGTVKIYGNKKSDGSLRNLGAGGAVHIVNSGTDALKEGAEIWLNDGSFTNDQQITGTVGGYLTSTNYQYFFADPDFSVIYKNSKFYAHKHNNWTYTASGATLTAKCKTCSYTVPLTVSAPADANYDGTTNRATASLSSSAVEKWDRIVNGTGGVTAPSITYTNSAGVSVSQAINGGTYYANIKAGSTTAKAAFTVNRIAPTADKLSYTAPGSLTYDGNDHAPTFTAKSGVTGLGNISVDYYLLNGEKVESAKMPGEYTVYAKVDDTGCNYTAANGLTSSSWKFTIVKNTSPVTINAVGEDFTYGDANKTGFKDLSVTGHEDFDLSSLVKTYYKETATAGEYESTGSTTVPTDVGNYKVVISVPDTDIRYEGSKSVTFSIAPKALTESDVEAISDVAYTGSELKPTVVVKDGEKPLAEGTDYAVTYTNNTNVGTATATITLSGNYTGTINKSFKITKATPTVTILPTAGAITYGQTLNDSTLTNGAASVEGTFAWTTGTTAPAVSDSETTEYEVTFTPTDTAHYSTVTCKVKVEVNKADYSNVTTTASGNLNAASGSTVEITLPTIPDGASYGTVTKTAVGDPYTLSDIAGGKITVTSTGITAEADMTFKVAVTPDDNHNGYEITVSVTPVFHAHAFSYSASGNVITATCANTDSQCDLLNGKITLTLTAEGGTYDGTTAYAAELTGKDAFIAATGASVGSIEYYKGTTKLEAAPKYAGDYVAKVTVGGETAEKAFKINKASPTVDQFDYTAPESTNLTYDGNGKTATVTFKDTSGKLFGMGNITVKYQKSGESTWSTNAPKNAGTYMVAIDVDEGNNYALVSDLTTDGWTFTIEKASVTVPGANTGTFTYTGEDQSYFTLTGNELYAVASGEGLSAATQKDAGSYAIKLSLKDADNYKWASGTGDPTYTFNIAKAALTATASSHTVAYGATAPTYTVSYEGWLKGEETPTTAAALTSEYTTTSNVGEYAVTFETAPIFANYYTVTTKNGKVTVERARTAAEPTAATGLVYTGKAQNGYTNAGTHVTLGGTSSATNAAESYSFTATPDANYAWSDGSTNAKTYNWSIVKAKAKITVDETPIVKTFGEAIVLPEATSTFGEVVCDKTAEALVDVGSYTVTYTVAGTSNYDGDTKTVSVTINQLAVNEPSVTGTYTYTGEEQTATVTGKEAYMTEAGAVKGTNAGDYTITYTLDGNHCWANGSDGKVTWSIDKADMVVGTNILAPSVPVPELVYDGSAKELLCAGQTWDEKDGASFGTFYYSVDGTDWSTNLPTAINAGEYNPVWYFVGDGNHNNIGSAEEPISQRYPIEISRGDQAVAIVAMNGYTYGGTLPEPSISITPSESAAVTYYYSATNTTTGGTEWKNMTATTLDAGTYYMYAVIAATDNFGSQTTEAAAFTVAKAYVTAPASGVGYTVDYANETITPADGYEVSTTRDDNFATGKLSGETDIVFGTTYYVRKVEDNNHNASEETPFSFTRPAAPAASAFTMTGETVENKKDGTFSGITAKMEYKKGDGDWTSGPATLTGLSNETVKVRYKATTAAFKSEEYSYTFTASPAKLTVTKNGETYAEVAYGDKLTKPSPDPEQTGYTFGGWYSDEECTQAWNFAIDTVKDNMTLYPKWIRNAVQKAAISGKVTESSTGVPGATVELYLGTVKVAATVTGESGNYSFDSVENGTYNIVVTKTDGKTKTEMVTVDTANTFAKDVELPTSDVSSQVEHKGKEVSDAKSEISKTVVGGLDTIAAAETPTAGQTITIKLIVEPKEESEVTGASDIKALAGSGKKVEFLDLSLLKITTTTQGELKGDIGDSNTQLLTIVIPFDFSGVNVSSVTILRQHGTDDAEKLTKNPAAGQEGYKVDAQAGTITLYAMKFSDYAVAYAEQSTGGHGGGSYTPGHTVTSDLKNVTKVTIDGKVVDSRYYTVSGGNIILSGEFMKTLANGKHTVKLYDGAKVATGIMTVSGNVAVASAATGDVGIALYGVLTISSLLGIGWVGKKKRGEE